MRLLVENATFRANPEYQVVLLDRLPRAEQQELLAGSDRGETYGALVARPNSRLDTQAVSSETALLVFTLASAGPIPGYVLERLDDAAERTIGRLVVDGVLEILDEGEFLSGPQVMERFAIAPSPPAAADLSVAALRYGQELTGLSQRELTLRLYSYGRRPISPQLSRQIGDGVEIPPVGGRWVRARQSRGAERHWREWIASTAARDRAASVGAGYKLYVSPAVEELLEVLEVLVDALPTAVGVSGFKIGAGLPGICRPDKVIVYFSQLEDLHAFARSLEAPLAGCAAHGVPFTAVVIPDGLLSWGADPPSASRTPSGATSWRMWVAERLAENLLSARDAGLTTVEPWQYALERLRLGGIDTSTWIPISGMWPELLAAG